MTDFGRPPAHKTTHQDAGVDEIAATGLVGRINYVDRGDPSSADFSAFGLTQNGQWHDLDLSSIIPAGAIAAHLALQVSDGLVSQLLRIREKGNSNTYNCLFALTVVANVYTYAQGFVLLDGDRKCEYDASNTTWSTMNVTVRGWLI